MDPVTRYTLGRNIARIMKIQFCQNCVQLFQELESLVKTLNNLCLGVNFQSSVPIFRATRSSDPQPPRSLEVKINLRKNKKTNKKAGDKKEKKTGKVDKARKLAPEIPQRKTKKLKSKKKQSLQVMRFKKLLQNLKKKQNFTKMKQNLTKGVAKEENLHHTTNCSYEEGDNYVINHKGKKYTCHMTFLVTHVMRCTRVTLGHQSHAKGPGFESNFVEQCFVEKKRQVDRWRCSRRLNATQWHNFSFKRINSSITSLKNLTSYAGMSFLCNRKKLKNNDHVMR